MFTTCPNCALNLAVTAADLRVGQGYVRCGRCVSVFNALISLADEAEVGLGDALEDRASATQSRPAPEGLDDLARLELAGRDLGETLDVENGDEVATAEAAVPTARDEAEDEADYAADEALPDPGELPEVDEESREMGTGTFETIVLEGDTILQTEEFVDEAEVDEQIKALAEQLEERENGVPRQELEGDEVPALEAALPRPAPVFVAEPAGAYEPAGSEELEGLITPRRARKRVSPYLLASIALALLLLLQAVHHWRQPLAARMPFVGAVYAGLGAPLQPQWQLAAYDVRQLGAAADPGDGQRIEIRASVRNAAERAQPAPVLRVILQDRFGNEIGRHERAPAQYLRGAGIDMLAADQRVDATFLVEDPAQKAVGFELDACLRSPDGSLRCAADAPPR